MENLLDRVLNYSNRLRELGYNVKIKFWHSELIDTDGMDVISFENTVLYEFYNLFESLLSDKTSLFNFYELQALARLFGVAINDLVEFFDYFIMSAYKILDKGESERTETEKNLVDSLQAKLEDYKKAMINYWLTSFEYMSIALQDDGQLDLIMQEYDDFFVFEPYKFGGR